MRIFDIYRDITERLKTDIPSIKYFDYWNNQHLFEDNYPFPTPACFISVSSGSFSELSANVQITEINLSVYLMDIIAEDTYNAPASEKIKTYQDILEGIYNSLNGQELTSLTEITKTNFENIVEHPAVYLFKQEFSGAVVAEV
ncbi:hypothetical protein ElyMa_002564000 [Elysia marginata]|uniref:Uncharacterized protein n=1 Tax=Elysia marginata TaxID=1093978 RepID=A0AAV4GYP6_9GAST|nr:hypothetical protein ElyMa_002564000 [Elysia marginata]